MTTTVQTTVTVDGPVRTVRMLSASRPDVKHTVLLACSCEGFQFNGYCYHLAEAARTLREDGQVQVSRTRARLKRF